MASSQEAAGDPPAPEEPAPDPDEDDLDDLDDVLDDFIAAKISETPQPSTTSSSTNHTKGTNPDPSGPGRPHPQNPPLLDEHHEAALKGAMEQIPGASSGTEEADFAAQLQTGMAEMMRELEANPEMAKQFEAMMAGLGAPGGVDDASQTGAPTDAPESKATAPSPAAAGTSDANFQDTIKRTMERMQSSNATATSASTDPSNAENDMMTSLLASMGNGAGGAPGADGDSDGFSSMLLTMMEQLTNKEILYEPMRELSSKFPSWLADRAPGASKASTITDAERARYQEQATLVGEIVTRFEKSGYDDSNPADREYIVERMQKMQAAGAPPSELVGDMGAAGDVLGDVDAGCPQQ